MKKTFFLLLIILLIPLQIHAVESVRENWGNLQISKNINPDIKFNFKTELRYVDHFDHYFNYIDLGLSWKTNKWISISVNFRDITKKSSGNWLKEYWPYADLKVTKSVQNFSISNRSRIETRFKEDANMYITRNKYLYRDKIELKSPKLTKAKLQPFIADDIFWDLDNKELYRNRVHLGVSCSMFKSLKYNLSYIYENTWKNDVRSDKNIMYLEVKYEF